MAVTPRQKMDEKDCPKEIIELQKASESTFTVALTAGAANVMTITIQAVDGLGAPVAGVRCFDFFMSQSPVGSGLTATAYSGGVAATTGAILNPWVAGKAFTAETDATGKFVATLTATAKPVGEYVAVWKPRGDLFVSAPSATILFG